MKLTRRRLIEAAGIAGAGTAASALAAPAIAQSAPELKWRLTSSFPKSLDAVYGAAELFARTVAELTDNKFQIQVFPAGEIVGAMEAANAVSEGTVEMCHTASYYSLDKDPAFALGTAIPFGLNARMQNAWSYEGGGIDLLNTFYAKHKLYGLPAGNTGAQMGGWDRKEVNAVDDLKGLKIRIGGLGGKVLEKLGAEPRQLPANAIYDALEKGEIDAAEWVGPYDDEKLGFYRVAKFFYYPGWWEGGAILHNFVNLEKWNALPKAYQAAIKSASCLANAQMLARYDTSNPTALKRLVGSGAQLRPFSEAVLDACFRTANELYGEIGKENADFKKIYQSIKAFRADSYLWFQLSENTYDTYMMIQQRKKTL